MRDEDTTSISRCYEQARTVVEDPHAPPDRLLAAALVVLLYDMGEELHSLTTLVRRMDAQVGPLVARGQELVDSPVARGAATVQRWLGAGRA